MTIEKKGMVFDIKKFAIHDGPGIRTTVFLKGCPLTCLWCHNPESQNFNPEISFMPDKCIGCGWCFEACEWHCHRLEEDQRIFDRTDCKQCGKCAEKCYAQAIELVGKQMSVDEVISEVMKDKAFYDNSGGGMTISGGEPMSQFEFTKALLAEAKQNALHTCLDTCGFTQFKKYEEIMNNVDIFLYDLKETSPELHKKYTGVDLQPILENLQKLDNVGASTYLRCPLIPGLNTRDEHIEGIASIANKMTNLIQIDLMLYHPLGESKLKRFGIESKLESKDFADKEEGKILQKKLESLCKIPVNIG